MLFNIMKFKKSGLSVGIIIMIMMLFLWINADWVYGPYSGVVRTTMTIYFFAFLLGYTFVNKTPKSLAGDESFWNFIIGFGGTSAVLIGITALIGSFSVRAALSEPFIATITIAGIGFGLLHAFIKAYIEEDIFRWVLPKLAGLGDVISNILFGIFHFSILVSMTIPAMITAGTLTDMGMLNWTYALLPVGVLVGLGMVWSQVRNVFGITGSTGSHTAWNMWQLGVLPILYGGMA